jgi:hypothetical protein
MSAGAGDYAEARLLLNGIDEFDAGDPEIRPLVALMIAEAQARATLSLAAVTAKAGGLVHNTNGHPSDWWTALHAGEGRS